jgi:hypothetical protein
MKDKSAAAGLLLGYARVSTDDQDLTNQRAELHAAGCTRIFAEKITGTRRDGPSWPGCSITCARRRCDGDQA